MEDQTLSSDLYNNIKFNMQKLIVEVSEKDTLRLSQIFNAPLNVCKEMLLEFNNTTKAQAETLKNECGIPAVTRSIRAAFIGDSITSDRESYFNILRQLYASEHNLKFIDASVSGDKSDDAVMKFYLRTLYFKPELVHILIGTNDLRKNNDRFAKTCVTLKEYEFNLEYMLQILKQNHANVVISTISPVIVERLKKRFPDDNWTYAQNDIVECNRIIESVADKYHVKLNDMRKVYEQYSPEDILLQDGLHLNSLGQLLLARNVLEAIKIYF